MKAHAASSTGLRIGLMVGALFGLGVGCGGEPTDSEPSTLGVNGGSLREERVPEATATPNESAGELILVDAARGLVERSRADSFEADRIQWNRRETLERHVAEITGLVAWKLPESTH